jgi:hypothetical protein
LKLARECGNWEMWAMIAASVIVPILLATGAYVEAMLNAFAKTSLSHEDQLADPHQRVAALEKRTPPQAA